MMDSKSDQFVQDLVQFYRNRGSHNPQPQQFVVRLNGKIVNLCELYSLVLENGGSFRVNQSNLWDDIYCKLHKTSVSGANISVALRQIYSRYLLPYEKAFSSNFGNDLLDDDEDESHFSFSNHNHNHTFTPNFSITPYSQYQQIPSNSVHENVNPINKLFCSLLSGLPNELDFALKVSTILINSNRFDWTSDSRFINLLLESSKHYCCICHEEDNEINLDNGLNYVDDYESDTNAISNSDQQTCDCYQRFWYQCCTNEQVLELVFGPRNLNLEEIPPQLFSKVRERVGLVADIIRNLSFTFDSENTSIMSSVSGSGTTIMLKFLLLLMMSDDQNFNNIALDILSNIAPATAFPHEESDYNLIQQYIHRHCIQIAMTSNNIHCTSRCLEIVSRLLSSNCEELNCTLESNLNEYEVFVRITQLMTCQYDITLLLAILEFCLAISEQRPYMLIKDDNKYLIKILLTLLNCEASQHFTATALKRMKVIDDRPRNQITSTETNSSQSTNSTQGVNSQSAITQLNSIDNETFALNWLRATYEPTTAVVSQPQPLKASDLYADYVKHCCRNSRRNVIAAQSFSQLIKSCFPSCSITNNQTLIEGIVAKSITTQTKSNQLPTAQLMSPILKAHLSAPPKNSNTITNTTNTNSNSSHNNSTNCNTSSPALISTPNTTSIPIPTTNTSTLIKSLLANKLRSNSTVSTTAITTTKSIVNSNISTNSTPIITTTPSTTTTITFTTTTSIPPTTTSIPITTASNIGTNESNNESVTISSPQLSSAITITPSISLTPTNTIFTASNATISGQQQPPQQFLLVRTIIASPGQQQSGCTGLTTTGTPVRLILPASMLTQQRLTNPTVNGISTTSTPLNNVSISAVNNNNNTNSVSNLSTNSSSTDLFLKTVLSGSNNSNSVPVTPIRSNVKSSPLLNVLLDKGKLPDFTTSNVLNNQVSSNAFGTVANTATLMQPQAPKMYILTTKSPLAIKSLPALQTQNQSTQQTTQCLQQQHLTTTAIQPQNSIQTSSAFITTTIANLSVTTLSTAPTTSTINTPKLSLPKNSITPAINGDISASVNSINTINTVNAVNSGTIFKTSSLNTINTIPTSDLSSIKDIKKAVDDATKLISKRRNEEESINSNKKVKINSVLAIPPSSASLNSINHESNTISITNSNSNINTNTTISSNTITNPQLQVLTKTSALLSTKTTSTVTSITTASNNNNTISNSNNNNNNNNCNNSLNNNNSVNCDYECQWNDCKKTFGRAAEVYLHVHNHHIMPSTFPNVMNCLWGGQEGTGPGCLSKRPKLSLLTHLLDFHCNPNVLQQDSLRKKQISSTGSSTVVLPQPPAHPGYAQNAALLAIRRHATNYVEPPKLPPITPLTPLTVSIRLTAALILRNLAQHSTFVKRTLECFETYLCELCMSDGRDESRTIAQCLAVITDKNIK